MTGSVVDDKEMVDLSNELCPKVMATKAELNAINGLWRGSLVLKVMGKRNTTILRRVGIGLGKPVRLDRKTQDMVRGNFAQICVVDLTKPLKPTIEVVGGTYQVEYEGMHQICFSCGRVGHRKESCLEELARNKATMDAEEEGSGEHSVESPAQAELGDHKTAAMARSAPEVVTKFGPWMHVQGKSRKSRQVIEKPAITPNVEPTIRGRESGNGSRFTVLQEEDLNSSGKQPVVTSIDGEVSKLTSSHVKPKDNRSSQIGLGNWIFQAQPIKNVGRSTASPSSSRPTGSAPSKKKTQARSKASETILPVVQQKSTTATHLSTDHRQDPALKPTNNAHKSPQAERAVKGMEQMPSKLGCAPDPTGTSGIILVVNRPSVEVATHQESNPLGLMEASTVRDMRDLGVVVPIQLGDGGGDASPFSKADC
ncbi:hypothetical protein CRG98_039679 [Punica granatum]|uniref:CCHC-type domain-containing protein n=1 Tax=Punica granatum TaxID=22663 RepID=A0A2I0I977_PUNGR|nr:hypothetical protein CRG98_039679 [Punica granatum]